MTAIAIPFPNAPTVELAKPKPSRGKSARIDYDLTQLAGQGDMLAFEELYQRHHRRVYSICLRMLKDPSAAEDLAQDTFVQLHRKINSFRGDSAFTTWLHRMTVNQVLMHFRKRHVKFELANGDTDLDNLGWTPITPGSHNPNRMKITDKIILEKAIDGLPDGYRNVFVLHDVKGFEHSEVADILGCSIGTSKSQLSKARRKLKKLINKKVNPTILNYNPA